MKIKWLENVELNIVNTIDDNEIIDDDNISIDAGIIDEVDIFGGEETKKTVDIQFDDGSCCFGVNKKWFEIIE